MARNLFDDPGFTEWIRQLNDIPMEDVADYYGIEREQMSIICPEHADRSLGSCKIHHNRYYCFACHAKGDNIKLVQKYRNVSFMDAARELAASFGYPEYKTGHSQKSSEPIEYMPVTKKQLAVLGLLPGKRPVFVAEKYQTWKEKNAVCKADLSDDNTGYVVGSTAMISPERLYREDKEAFFALIAGKFQESASMYLSLYQMKAWELQMFSDTMRPDFKKYLEERLIELDGLAKNLTERKLIDLSYFKLPVFEKQIMKYRLEL